jgi:uncharacterized protein (TIGR02246 family)
MMTIRLSACLASVLLAMAGTAFAYSPQEEADAAAHAMVSRFVNSWNRADGAAYGENYWPDAELVNPSGVVLAGRAAIVKEHVELWKGIFKATRQTATIRRTTVLCPDYIVVDFDARLSGFHALPPGANAPPGGVLVAHLKHIMQKRHGVWKILLAQNTLVAASQSAR